MPAPRGPALDLPDVSFFGRSLAEYSQFFDLDVPALRGRDVLDVGAGPSSFTAEACQRRVQAVGVDPAYGSSTGDVLKARIDADYAAMSARILARQELFRVGPPGASAAEFAPGSALRRGPAATPCVFESLEAAEADRRAAAERFLADYATQYANGRYISGSLPRLPFFDRTFDLVLCAHLLFIHAAQFDFDWHLAACRELVRVSAGEVRIHPLCGPDGRPYPRLASLRRELRAAGIESVVTGVPYEFFSGSASMLVLKHATRGAPA